MLNSAKSRTATNCPENRINNKSRVESSYTPPPSKQKQRQHHFQSESNLYLYNQIAQTIHSNLHSADGKCFAVGRQSPCSPTSIRTLFARSRSLGLGDRLEPHPSHLLNLAKPIHHGLLRTSSKRVFGLLIILPSHGWVGKQADAARKDDSA